MAIGSEILTANSQLAPSLTTEAQLTDWAWAAAKIFESSPGAKSVRCKPLLDMATNI